MPNDEWLIDAAWYTTWRQQLHTESERERGRDEDWKDWTIDRCQMDGWMQQQQQQQQQTKVLSVKSRTQLRWRWWLRKAKKIPRWIKARPEDRWIVGSLDRSNVDNARCRIDIGLGPAGSRHSCTSRCRGRRALGRVRFHESDWLQSKCRQSDQLKRLMMINYRRRINTMTIKTMTRPIGGERERGRGR